MFKSGQQRVLSVKSHRGKCGKLLWNGDGRYFTQHVDSPPLGARVDTPPTAGYTFHNVARMVAHLLAHLPPLDRSNVIFNPTLSAIILQTYFAKMNRNLSSVRQHLVITALRAPPQTSHLKLFLLHRCLCPYVALPLPLLTHVDGFSKKSYARLHRNNVFWITLPKSVWLHGTAMITTPPPSTTKTLGLLPHHRHRRQHHCVPRKDQVWEKISQEQRMDTVRGKRREYRVAGVRQQKTKLDLFRLDVEKMR